MNQYYGWPGYGSLAVIAVPLGVDGVAQPEGNPHLRSAKEVAGYEVAATDGVLGRLEELIIQDADWFIRYLAVGTGSWFAGHKLLVPTRWVESVSWPEHRILLSQPRENL